MFKEFIPFIEDLANKSAGITVPLFDDPAVVAEFKEDQTPVTKADKDCELMLREVIQRKFPQHGIVGEEFGVHNTTAEWTWVLDPIDGTASFVHGVPLFTTLIGLMYQGKPVLGAIYQPILNKLCIGSQEGTFLNGQRCKVRVCNSLGQATMLSSGVSGIHGALPTSADQLLKKVRIFRTWGDGWGYMMVARGLADIMLDASLKLWDLAAVLPVIQGAGGVTRSLKNGDPMIDLSLVATSAKLMPMVLREIGEVEN